MESRFTHIFWLPITALIFWLPVFLAIVHVASSKEESDKVHIIEKFIPTHEWKVVQKGQPIPKGLHVRINFETGKTEAKLLDNDDASKNALSVSALSIIESIKDTEGNTNDNSNLDGVKEAMKKIKGDYKEKENNKMSPSPFRTYSELKKDLEDMHIKVKSDMELILELTSNYLASTDEMKVSILTDLEYLVHQIDNAREFARLNGFTDIINPCFNSTNGNIRSEAIKLLGTAVQSNTQVQISALSSGSIQLLLRTILLDKSSTVRSRALYALSCLIRSFPPAQIKMIAEGGLTVLARAFDQENNKIQFQVKVVTLLSDLLEERRTTSDLVNDKEQTSKELLQTLDQYKITNLEQKLVEAGWCNRVPQLLLSETISPDNDVVEKVLNAMQTLIEICGGDISFKNLQVIKVLQLLEIWYKKFAELEKDDYYRSLAELAANLQQKLVSVKNEL